MNKILDINGTNPNVTKIDQLININNQLNYRLPFINSINFRYGITGSIFRDPIYGDFINEGIYNINFETNSFTKIKLQSSLKAIQNNIYITQKKEIIAKTLEERYDLLINLISTAKNIAITKQTFTLLNEQQKAYEIALAQNKNIDVTQVIKLEEEINSITYKITNLNNELKKIQLSHQLITKDTLNEKDINNWPMLTIETIETVINNLQIDENNQITQSLIESQINYKTTELGILKNKYFNFFKGIQIGYDQQIFDIETPDKQKSRNNFGIRANFSIPLAISYKRDLNYIQEKLRIANYQTNLRREIEVQKLNFQQTIDLVKYQIQEYQNQRHKTAQNLISKMMANTSLKNDLEPTEWNKLNLAYLKQENFLSQQYLDILSNYIKLLKISGRLYQFPLINYLSNDLELL